MNRSCTPLAIGICLLLLPAIAMADDDFVLASSNYGQLADAPEWLRLRTPGQEVPPGFDVEFSAYQTTDETLALASGCTPHALIVRTEDGRDLDTDPNHRKKKLSPLGIVMPPGEWTSLCSWDQRAARTEGKARQVPLGAYTWILYAPLRAESGGEPVLEGPLGIPFTITHGAALGLDEAVELSTTKLGHLPDNAAYIRLDHTVSLTLPDAGGHVKGAAFTIFDPASDKSEQVTVELSRDGPEGEATAQALGWSLTLEKVSGDTAWFRVSKG